MKRTLTLKRETLADLTTAELAYVQGAAIETVLRFCVLVETVETSSPIRCFSRGFTCINCE